MTRKVDPVEVIIHPSQHPGQVHRDLIDGLARGEVASKFLYETRVQAARWAAVHEAFSPARREGSRARKIYRAAASRAVVEMTRIGSGTDVIGLGCGTGHKEAEVLGDLVRPGGDESADPADVRYVPADVSVALVQQAVVNASDATGLPARGWMRPVIADLERAGLAGVVDCCRGFLRSDAARLVTFFGVLPNLRLDVFGALRSAMRPADRLLLSANLIGENPDAAEVSGVLTQYDNPPTMDWLWTFLESLGVRRSDGHIRFSAAPDSAAPGWIRIRADFEAHRDIGICVEGEPVEFMTGRVINLFFSHRPSPRQILDLLRASDFELIDSWISGEDGEGVYFCGPGAARV